MKESKFASKIFKNSTWVFILLPFLSFFVGVEYQSRSSFQGLGELRMVHEDLNLCLQNRGKVSASYQTRFPIQDLRISSSLLEGKEALAREWFYKGSSITEYSLEVANQNPEGQPIEVKIWDYRNIDEAREVIFDHSGNAKPIIGSDTSSSSTYAASTRITWSRSYGELSILQNISSIHRIYIQIIGNQITGWPDKDWQYYVDSSTKELEPIADSIYF